MSIPRLLSFVAILIIAHATTSASAPKKPRVDAVGDPLPAQALHRFGTSRFCTQAEVASLVLSPDGKLLAATDRDRRVYLWDTDRGKPRALPNAHRYKNVAFSPDGQWLMLGDEGGFQISNLRMNAGRALADGGPRLFAFTPDSKGIALVPAENGAIVVEALDGGKELRRFAALEDKVDFTTIAFSPDGRYFAGAGVPMVDMDKAFVRVVLWDASNGKKLKHIDQAGRAVRGLVFLPDNKTLVGQVDHRLAGWAVPALNRIDKIDVDVGSSFALDARGKILASTDGPKVVEFDTGKALHEFDVPAQVRYLAMSADAKLLAASAANFEAASPRILLWDLTTGKERVVPAAHRHHVDAVAFSHDGKAIATASHVEGVARVWDAKNARLLHTLNLNKLAAQKSGGPSERRSLLDGLAFSVDRPELFVSGQRWDLMKGTPIPLKDDDDFAFEQTNSRRAIMTADGRLAASFLHNGAILFWDPAKAKPIQRIEIDKKKMQGDWHAFAFAPGGKLAASGKWFPPLRKDDGEPLEHTINLWDIAAGKLAKSVRTSRNPVVRLMFSPDGETLAVIGFPARLELWHLPTGRLLREMYLTSIDETAADKFEFVMPAVAFAPHGQWLAFANQEGEIALLETMTGKEIFTLRGHLGHVSSVAFAPDSRRLLSGGRDTTALLWSLLPDNPTPPANAKDADKLWLDLGGPTEQAYRVVWSLLAQPERAVEVLAKRLRPDSGATDKEIRELIANLSSAKKFAERDAAVRRLKEIGVRSLPALEQSLKNAPDLETGRRIQELLKTVETALTPETLRDYRALLILEMIGTPAARQLLSDIARGDVGAGKTRMARAALERVSKGQ